MNRMLLIATLSLIYTVVSACSNSTKQQTALVETSDAVVNDLVDSTAISEKYTKVSLTEDEWRALKASQDRQEKVVASWKGRTVSELQAAAEMAGNPEEYALAGKLIYYGLQKRDYSFLSDAAYVERVKQVFGIDLNNKAQLKSSYIKQRNGYDVYLPPSAEHGPPSEDEFGFEEQNFYFFRKYKLLILQPDLYVDRDLSTDRNNVYLSNSLLEENYHWNNYLLNGNTESLEWLTLNGGTYYTYQELLCSLLEYFGYDTEETINKAQLEVMSHVSVGHVGLNFASRDIENRLQIRENLLKTLASNTDESSDVYYKMLEEYLLLMGTDEDDAYPATALRALFDVSERRKILAYCMNTLHPLYKEYFMKGNQPVSDVLLKVFAADSGLADEIKSNNYYKLPYLQEVIKTIPEVTAKQE